MSNRINLTRVRSCGQVWEDMPAAEGGGRICGKCEHQIIDFRKMSDREVAETHMFAEGKVCGLYRPDQLAPPEASLGPGRFRSRRASLSLAGMLTAVTAQPASGSGIDGAPAQHVSPKMVDHPSPRTGVRGNRADTLERPAQSRGTDTAIITGTVVDHTYGEPLIGLTVRVDGLGDSIGYITDTAGRYRVGVPIPPDFSGTVRLVYTYVGFGSEERVLDARTLRSLRSEINVILSESQDVQYEYFGVSRAPLHVRVWRSVKGMFSDRG